MTNRWTAEDVRCALVRALDGFYFDVGREAARALGGRFEFRVEPDTDTGRRLAKCLLRQLPRKPQVDDTAERLGALDHYQTCPQPVAKCPACRLIAAVKRSRFQVRDAIDGGLDGSQVGDTAELDHQTCLHAIVKRARERARVKRPAPPTDGGE